MQARSLKRTQFTDDERKRIVAEAASATVRTVCRNHCISFSTFYRWRARLTEHQTKIGARLFDLECENRKLKKQVAELWLDYTSLRSALIDGMGREC
jgi:putative transposase